MCSFTVTDLTSLKWKYSHSTSHDFYILGVVLILIWDNSAEFIFDVLKETVEEQVSIWKKKVGEAWLELQLSIFKIKILKFISVIDLYSVQTNWC